MRDITQGRLILLVSFIVMILYFYALFLVPSDVPPIERNVWEWALIIPVTLIVYLFLVVVAWIGWAMATTPPPLPLVGKKPNESKNEKKGTT